MTKQIKLAAIAPLALILVSFFWGVTFPWVKEAMKDFTPLYWVGFRFAFAAVLFSLIFIRSKGNKSRGKKEGIILGLVLGSAFILQTVGLKYSSSATMGLLTALILPFIFVLETFVARKRLSVKVKTSLVLAFAGFVMLSYKEGMRFHSPDLLGVFASLGFAFQIFLVGKWAPKYSISTLNFFQMLVISLLGFLGGAIFEDFSDLNFSSHVAVSSIVFTAVFCSFMAFFVQTWAQRFVSPAKTTLFFSLEPLFAAIISWMIYYEEITPLKVIGGALLLFSLIIVQLRKSPLKKSYENDRKMDQRFPP